MAHLMKTVLVGDDNDLNNQFRELYGKGFNSKYMMTIGADYALFEKVIEGKTFKFQIWGLKGQERFGAVRSVYYLGTLGAILIFNVKSDEKDDD